MPAMPAATTVGHGGPAQTVFGHAQSGPPAMPAPLAPQPAAGMAASVASPPAAMAPIAAPPGDPRSPWAPPGGKPAPATLPVAAVPTPAAPVVAAPVVAAPVVAAAQAAAPQGKRKAEEDNKGKFRETMWFKKGDLDAQAAIAAAEERARTGKDVGTDKADSKPIDERYNDDGSITRGDKEKYSLRTGSTMMMQSVDKKNPSASLTKVSEDELIGEMKGGRTGVIIAIVLALAAIAAIVYFIAM